MLENGSIHRKAGRVWPVLLATALAGMVSTGPAFSQVSPGDLAAPHAALDTVRNCKKCHERGGEGMDGRCLDCHRGIREKIRGRSGFHGRRGAAECSGCHPDHAGREFELVQWEDGGWEKFRHQRAGWALTGKHDGLDCRKCHRPKFQQAELLEGEPGGDHSESWLGLSPDCRNCHLDPHAGELGTDCESCHGTGRFKPAVRLDHDKTRYPLTGKHRDVKCEKCHLVPGKRFSRGADGRVYPRYRNFPFGECSDCHKDIHAGAFGPVCSECHGTAGFKLVDPARFNHRKTRWPLLGKHAAVKCAGCHDPDKAWGKKPPFRRCDDCHRDAHNGQAALAGRKVDCSACHDEKGFSPSTYTAERHRESAYPLKGKHRRVECRSCHGTVAGTKQVRLRPAHDRCMDCHRDAHGGQLRTREDGGACESCHTVDGWTPSTYGLAEHGKLKVTLAGRHGKVECAACHGMRRKGLRPLPAGIRTGKAKTALTGIETGCAGCHLDVHGGRFEPAGERPSENGCAGCHDQAKFSPSRVDVAAHGRFAFKLEGGHRAVPCTGCHEELKQPASAIRLLEARGNPRTLEFKEPHDRCADCHRTPHGTEFDHRPDRGACEGCHTVKTFDAAPRFDHEREARFALKGAHRDVPCVQCHGMADGRRVWRPLPKDCKDCHRNGTRWKEAKG